jgi:hypothetical protein
MSKHHIANTLRYYLQKSGCVGMTYFIRHLGDQTARSAGAKLHTGTRHQLFYAHITSSYFQGLKKGTLPKTYNFNLAPNTHFSR